MTFKNFFLIGYLMMSFCFSSVICSGSLTNKIWHKYRQLKFSSKQASLLLKDLENCLSKRYFSVKQSGFSLDYFMQGVKIALPLKMTKQEHIEIIETMGLLVNGLNEERRRLVDNKSLLSRKNTLSLMAQAKDHFFSWLYYWLKTAN